jgi:hypothetical protein
MIIVIRSSVLAFGDNYLNLNQEFLLTHKKSQPPALLSMIVQRN